MVLWFRQGRVSREGEESELAEKGKRVGGNGGCASTFPTSFRKKNYNKEKWCREGKQTREWEFHYEG